MDVFCTRRRIVESMTTTGTTTWATDSLDLVGNKEACDLLEIHKSTLARWMKPSSGPHGETGTYMVEWRSLRAGPLWHRLDVVDFAATKPRKRAPRTGR